jgi:hypothetical protein
MSVPAVLPPVTTPDLGLSFGAGPIDLATRALVVAVVPPPRWGREAEVLAGVRQAADAGADVVEVPAEPRLLGPAASAGIVPVAARVTAADAARAAWAAGARLLLVPAPQAPPVVDDPAASDWQLATLVTDARGGRAAVAAHPDRPVALDVTGLPPVDAVAEASLAIAVGVRVIRTGDLRRTRRVVEVMAHLLEARR